MRVERDFVDFIKLLNKHNVQYLIVGAYAMALYSEPRNTGDIDFFIEPTEANALKVLDVLKEFGMESLDISISDLINENMVVQLGVAPVRIDLLSSISGVNFNEAYTEIEKKKFGETEANFISKKHLIKNKKASNRKKDISDLEILLKSE